MLALIRRVRFAARALGRRVQAAVVRWALYVLYFAGLGAVHLWLRVFHRSILVPAGEAGWRDAGVADFDESDSLLQS